MLPKISVIIPVLPGEEVTAVLSSLKNLKYPQDKIEILLVSGKWPAHQRNLGAKKARGEILYFLDSDSQADPNLFREVVNFYLWPKIAAVGGPSLVSRQNSFFQKILGQALGSFFAHGQMCARYRQTGGMREATEKELICCNLSVRRKVFLKVGGFNESLYPNEENEFLSRLKKADHSLIYNPSACVYRAPRRNIAEFMKQFFTYGRGRMEQMRIEKFVLPKFLYDLPFLLPLLLIVYLLSLIFQFLIFPFTIYYIPVTLYFILGFLSALGFALNQKNPFLLFILPFIYLLMHASYGVGLFWGIFTNMEVKKLRRKAVPIQIKKIKLFNSLDFDYNIGSQKILDFFKI